jgi:hypothetical protein
MSNPFDAFDAPAAAPVAIAPATTATSSTAANPFDAFDEPTSGAAMHPTSGPTGSLMVDLPRRAGTAVSDALGATLAIPRLAAQGVDWGWNKLGVDSHADAALGAMTTPDGQQLFPDAGKAREMAYATTGATEYKPATTVGRYLQAGLAAAPTALVGGLGAVLPSIAGGATAEAAGELMPDHPILARALGFGFGAHTANAMANGAAKTVGMVTGTAPTTPLFQAYERQGVPTTLSGDVTQNPTLQLAQSMAAKMPGGSGVIRTEGGKAIDAWQAAAERAASQLGPSANMQDAGTALQNASQQWLQDWKSQSAAKWGAFKQAVPGTTQIPVSNFQQAITDVNGSFGGATNLAKALQDGLGSKMADALKGDLTAKGTLPWQAVQATRTRLGEMLASGQPVADTTQSAIKRLYAGLSNDMQAGAAASSPAAAKAFNDANAYTRTGHTLLEDHLNPILNATNPETAAQYALSQIKQGGSRLEALSNAMPGSTQDLGATVLRQAAESGTGGLPNKLKNISPQAQNQLFGPAQQHVQDLNDISQAMRRTVQTTGNNSNTAAHESNGLGRIMSAIEMGKAGHEMAGLPGRIAGIGVGMMAPNAVGAGARMLGANPLLSRIYSTNVEPFTAPSLSSPNSLLQLVQPDRRNLPGIGPMTNQLLPDPRSNGSTAVKTMP